MEFTDFKVVGVDRDNIEKDLSVANAYKYSFLLSSKPDDIWVKFLHRSYHMSSFSRKRQYAVIDSSVVFTVLCEDNMQAQLDFLKELVASANEDYRKMIEKEFQEKREEEVRRRQEQETIERLRQEVDRLSF